MASRAAVLARARQFVEWDVNPETREQARAALAAAEAASELPGGFANAYGAALEFGTAGLRGEMGPGFARMNDLTVIQAAQGLVAYLEEAHAVSLADAKARGIVLGFDHRALGALNSRRFAVLTAVAASARGWRVFLMNRFTLTPLVPFTIVKLGAAAGVMVTASHNPKRDDGYKVYWGNGAQIIAPVDKGIAAAIADPANQAPWAACREAYVAGDEAVLRSGSGGLVVDRTEELMAAYVATVTASQSVTQQATAAAGSEHAPAFPVKMAYTAMHGVGTPFAQAMFASFGLPPLHLTPEQVEPDPEFPTVAFPNPEEGKGALALAMATAARTGSTLILANDPDADRLAVAEWQPAPDGAGASSPAAAALSPTGGPGEWRVFTGNEIGALLGAWAWERYVAGGGAPAGAVMVASTVSSKFLKAMAAAEGFAFLEVLTGFKWMGNAMADAREGRLALPGDPAGAPPPPRRVIFAFEEAIGFSCGDAVRDKDGVSAAAVFAEMAQELGRRGLTAAGRLGQLYARYGLFLTQNHYLFVDAPAKTEAIFKRLRNEGHYWSRLTMAAAGAAGGAGAAGAPLAITAIRDLTSPGWDSEGAGGRPSLPTSSGSHMITYKFSNGVVATLRTSGTEPKLKYYCELGGGDASKPEEVRAELARTVEAIISEMLQPELHGLKR